MDPAKVLIIGNAGSGKTWLGTRLAKRLQCEVMQLDDIFWMLGGTERGPTPEERTEVEALVQRTRKPPRWVVEGAQGNLAQFFLDGADTLVWLDFEWDYCRGRILERRAELESRGESILGSSTRCGAADFALARYG